MKIYIASRFRTLTLITALKAALESAGHNVISTWHENEARNPMPLDDPGYPEHAASVALRDLREVETAEAVVVLANDCELTPGGLWVETGYAMGVGIPVFVLGPKVNVFCYPPIAEAAVSTTEDLLHELDQYDSPFVHSRREPRC